MKCLSRMYLVAGIRGALLPGDNEGAHPERGPATPIGGCARTRGDMRLRPRVSIGRESEILCVVYF